jgi:hypothetical protein
LLQGHRRSKEQANVGVMQRSTAARRENDKTLIILLPSANCLGIELYKSKFVVVVVVELMV